MPKQIPKCKAHLLIRKKGKEAVKTLEEPANRVNKKAGQRTMQNSMLKEGAAQYGARYGCLPLNALNHSTEKTNLIVEHKAEW